MPAPFARTRQCGKCPWKVRSNPSAIPGDYDPDKHRDLIHCNQDTGRIMACHESTAAAPYACVGWLVNQIGPGNNMRLRMRTLLGQFDGTALRVFGKQHESLEAMCAAAPSCGATNR